MLFGRQKRGGIKSPERLTTLTEKSVAPGSGRVNGTRVRPLVIPSGPEVNESIQPLLLLSRETIARLQKTERALVSSLKRDPLLAERIKRLRTVPRVGPITALTWALEMGISRFPSIRHAISYCGLCGDQRSSADKSIRTPLSKQRNKNIQFVLIEAAKLASRHDPDLAIALCQRETERQF
jgi:transposase